MTLWWNSIFLIFILDEFFRNYGFKLKQKVRLMRIKALTKITRSLNWPWSYLLEILFALHTKKQRSSWDSELLKCVKFSLPLFFQVKPTSYLTPEWTFANQPWTWLRNPVAVPLVAEPAEEPELDPRYGHQLIFSLAYICKKMIRLSMNPHWVVTLPFSLEPIGWERLHVVNFKAMGIELL